MKKPVANKKPRKPALRVVPPPIAVPVPAKPPVPRVVQLNTMQAYELRCIELKIAELNQRLQLHQDMLKRQATIMAQGHGVDITKGPWALNSDLGTITEDLKAP